MVRTLIPAAVLTLTSGLTACGGSAEGAEPGADETRATLDSEYGDLPPVTLIGGLSAAG